jgi:hypothetical protein
MYPSIENKRKVNNLSKKIKLQIKEIRSNNWMFVESCGKNLTSSRPFWRKINEYRGSNRLNNIPTLKYDNKSLSSDIDKTKCFSMLLETTFSNNLAAVSEHEKMVRDTIKNLDFFDENDCAFEQVSKFEVVNIFRYLKPNSSPGDNGIYNLMLKNLPEVFVDLLANMINLSMVTSTTAKVWKLAVVNMIPKKEGSSSDPTKFRPISLTSCKGKVAERVIKNRLVNFLESNRLLVKQQSGFRKNRITHDNIFIYYSKSIRMSF